MSQNPFVWRGDPVNDAPRVPRSALVADLLGHLKTSNAIVVGGFGMGKSWLLDELADTLRGDGQSLVALIKRAPLNGGVAEVVRQLLRAVEPDRGALDPLVEQHVFGKERGTVLEDLSERAVQNLPARILSEILDNRQRGRIVAIFDEVESYVDQSDRGSLARATFNRLNAWSQELRGRLRVLAAGGIGVYGLKTYLGSAFVDNAGWSRLQPFSFDELRQLAAPFASARRPLAEETLRQLMIHTGGHAALSVYGFQRVWDKPGEVGALDVARVLAGFAQTHPGFVRGYFEKLSDPRWTTAVTRVLDRLQAGAGPYHVSDLRRLLVEEDGVERLRLDEVLAVLSASGAVRERQVPVVEGDEVHVDVIPSILLPHPLPKLPRGTPQARLCAGVAAALANMQRWATAWFHGDGEDRKLVPEANLAASIALQLSPLGMNIELEAVRGPGRTDVLLDLADVDSPAAGKGVIETKIWGRKGYETIDEQTRQYCLSADIVAAVAVTFTERIVPQWADTFEQKCLKGRSFSYESLLPPPSLSGHFRTKAALADGREVTVDHLLLYMPRAADRAQP